MYNTHKCFRENHNAQWYTGTWQIIFTGISTVLMLHPISCASMMGFRKNKNLSLMCTLLCWNPLALCCRMVADPTMAGYFCNRSEGQLNHITQESLRWCRMACLLNSNCKAITYDTRTRLCIRHTETCIILDKNANYIYENLVSNPNGQYGIW